MKHHDAEVFLDTGYLLALELPNDQHHAEALSHWRWQRSSRTLPRLLVTTSYVFDEVVTFLNGRGHHRKAVEVGQRLMASPSMELVHVDERLFERGFGLLERRSDKRYSLTDCVSFIVMRERSIAMTFTFDRHFEQEGFVVEPHGGQE